MLISSSSRYSIYKVQCSLELSLKLAHSITSDSVCQELFSSFSNFFRRIFCFCVARKQLSYFITSDSICQELFSSFFKFLRLFFTSSLPRRQLAYTSTHLPICQVLFHLLCLIFIIFRIQSFIPVFLLFEAPSYNASTI